MTVREFPSNYPSSPKDMWRVFYDFTQIPRPSRQEDKIIAYLANIAQKKDLKYVIDNVGNIIIYVPGRNGREKDAPLIIQNHVDMVTDALPGRDIDFSSDSIDIYVEGDWLKARGTTLGADNGIGCAAALAVVFDDDLIHPPLELLFTIDEETGLNGALGLEHKYLSGKKMLNLDTEEWGSLYIGCAGGIDYELTKDLELVDTSSDKNQYLLEISGLTGGHSGVDIHEQRGNALKFLADYLNELLVCEIDFEIAEIQGGKAHNIIPRDAKAYINFSASSLAEIEEIGEKVQGKWLSYSSECDKDLTFSLTQMSSLKPEVLTSADRDSLIQYMILFPHGAHTYDLEDRKLVSMSNNFAKFLVMKGKVYTQSSLRFFDRQEVKSLESKISVLGKLFEMKVETHSEYPSWKPVRHNPVLDKVQEVYFEMHGKKAEVTAIHAGLECGILRDKIGPIDVISFGPTIMGAHSPEERVFIPSVLEFWNLYINVLKVI